MKLNNIVLSIHETCTFPVWLAGFLWYTLIQTPFFQGRTKGFNELIIIAAKADLENEQDE